MAALLRHEIRSTLWDLRDRMLRTFTRIEGQEDQSSPDTTGLHSEMSMACLGTGFSVVPHYFKSYTRLE